MCGLVVTMSFDGGPADADLLERTSSVIAHRGPDDFGIATYGPVGFGFRRLAIIDLSPAGHQPMEDASGQLAVVFNGEIYNYIELKRELEQLGRSFRSSSDTEVLLQAYDQWGNDCVRRFNGMWAFAIYDKRRKRLVASRDRFGVKPLYRWSDGKRLILASEIKAILASGWCRPSPNWPAVAKFLSHGHVDDDNQTFYSGIEQVPAGSILSVDPDGTESQNLFWNLKDIQQQPIADPVGEFRTLFEDAVRLRMRSDVPVGVCLSGGIDSNAVISEMASLRGSTVSSPLQAFSYIPDEFSEEAYIRNTIAQTGAQLHPLTTSPREIWDVLPSALWHYDEPVHSPAALIGYQLMRLAKSQGVTVVLNGQGADEVNAGYHAYFQTHWTDLMRAWRWPFAMQEVREYSRAHKQPYGSLLRSTFAYWVSRGIRQVPGFGVARDLIAPTQRNQVPWISAELLRHLPPIDPDAWTKPLRETQVFSVEHRPLPLYLRVEDRNSMAHSVEARLPFLDYRLVTLAFSLSGEWKLRGEWNKYVVREAMKGVIAEPVRTRLDKMGFPTPSKDWWRGPWFGPMMDLLGSQRLRESGVCNVDSARTELQRHAEGEVNAAGQLFRLAQFGIWLTLDHAAPRDLRIASARAKGNHDLEAVPTTQPFVVSAGGGRHAS